MNHIGQVTNRLIARPPIPQINYRSVRLTIYSHPLTDG